MALKPDRFYQYNALMRQGKMPPKHWTDQASELQKRTIYDSYVEWYIEQIRKGETLPRNPPFRGMFPDQVERIYKVRGYGSTDRLNGHRGALVQLRHRFKKPFEEPLSEEQIKRNACKFLRKERKRSRAYKRTLRQAAKSGWVKPGDTERSRRYWFNRFDEMRTYYTREYQLRGDIKIVAKHHHALVCAAIEIEKFYGKDYFLLKVMRKGGLFSYKPANVVENFLYEAEICRSVRLDEKISFLNEKQTAAESARQLRALGFVV